MTLPEVLFLALLQGLTEFLPVSSSGHLVLAGSLFDTPLESSFALIVIIHVATAAAALVFYRKDISVILRGLLAGDDESRRLCFIIATATLATAVIGLGFQPAFEGLFLSPGSVAPSLFATGTFLIAASFVPPGGQQAAKAPYWKALLIGIAQGVAIIPGISRSGATIAAGLFLGLRREEAVRFSFFLLIPATVGATLLEGFRIASLDQGLLLQSVAGFLTAALVGYASIYLVLRWTSSGRLWYFGLYCWAVAGVAVLWGRLG